MTNPTPKLSAILIAFFAAVTVAVVPTRATDLPHGFYLENLFPGTSWTQPTQVLFLPDGRALVFELPGRVFVVLQDGTKVSTPFLDLQDEVGLAGNLGILGAAIDPDWADAPWVYLGYTVDPNEDGVDGDPDHFIRVTRYQPSEADSNVADPTTRQVLLGAMWPESAPSLSQSHSIGALHFGHDNSLLVAVGDGAHFKFGDNGGADPDAFGPGKTDPAEDMGAFRARYIKSLSGSILRIDKETGLGLSDNPFWTGDGTAFQSKIYLYGLRNPYRFCVRPGPDVAEGGEEPGTLYIGDVGYARWEELDIVKVAGLNFGWPCREGAYRQDQYNGFDEVESGNENVLCDAPLSEDNPVPDTEPVLWWNHFSGEDSNPPGWVGQAVVGGVFYTADSYPVPYRGHYFVADYGGSWIRLVQVSADDDVTGWANFADFADGPVHLTTHPENGDLVYVSYNTEQIRRIRYDPNVSTGDPAPEVSSVRLDSMPNPFRRTTMIRFALPEGGPVSLRVLDATGRVVTSLLESRHYGPGQHVVEWEGLDGRGRSLRRGVYFARLAAGGRLMTGKIVLR